MKKFETLEDVAQKLGDGGSHSPDTRFSNVGELVNALVDLGREDEVYSRHDDHLGLKEDLPQELLASSIEEAGNPAFEDDVSKILEQANIIIAITQGLEDARDD